MKHVKLRMVKYFVQSISENQLPYLKNKEKEVFDKVLELCESNKLYADVWEEIETEAKRLVRENCEPKWKEIIWEMSELWNKRNELNKQLESIDDEDFQKDINEKLDWINKRISDLNEEYQKITDDANKELAEFKETVLARYKDTSCFDLKDNEYNIIDSKIKWSVYDWLAEELNKDLDNNK